MCVQVKLGFVRENPREERKPSFYGPAVPQITARRRRYYHGFTQHELGEKSSPLSLQIVNCTCWLIPNAAVIANRCWLSFGGTDTLGFIRWCENPVRLQSCLSTYHLQICYAWDCKLAKVCR